MKTTVEISDGLFQETTSLARAKRTTLGGLIEEGPRQVLKETGQSGHPFKLRDGSVDGDSLTADASWPEVRRKI